MSEDKEPDMTALRLAALRNPSVQSARRRRNLGQVFEAAEQEAKELKAKEQEAKEQEVKELEVKEQEAKSQEAKSQETNKQEAKELETAVQSAKEAQKEAQGVKETSAQAGARTSAGRGAAPSKNQTDGQGTSAKGRVSAKNTEAQEASKAEDNRRNSAPLDPKTSDLEASDTGKASAGKIDAAKSDSETADLEKTEAQQPDSGQSEADTKVLSPAEPSLLEPFRSAPGVDPRKSVLSLTNIVKTYGDGAQRVEVLRQASLIIGRGQIVGLIGPSGSGKSTLLQIAGLLDAPTTGSIHIKGGVADDLNDRQRTLLRRDTVGFVYQFHHLLKEFSALENVMMPQRIAGVSDKQARIRAQELLGRVGLQERMHHRPAKLSGGEQQRVAIARALANRPALLLADEPTGNLDPETAESVFQMLLSLTREEGMAALIATHNLELGARMDRQVRLDHGQVHEL